MLNSIEIMMHSLYIIITLQYLLNLLSLYLIIILNFTGMSNVTLQEFYYVLHRFHDLILAFNYNLGNILYYIVKVFGLFNNIMLTT